MTRFRELAAVTVVLTLTASAWWLPRAPRAQSYDTTALGGAMRWRAIGPFRGGRTKAITGVPGDLHTFYMAPVNGGVWKTTDLGRTWTPIFDDQPTGSIGSIAVAPSDPNVIYVGSGEGLARPDLSVGDGIYKSTDAGRSWTHLGLRDGQQIPYIIVDPRNANRLFVAVLGHPYGPNEERGVYRSTDGGATFQKVLSKDENTGASDLEFDPKNPDIVYACLWEQRQGPWENGAWAGTTGGIFKSIDGGTTWRQLSKGLPAEGIVQADIAVAPSDGNRIYATVANPQSVRIYRSDDAGDSWTQITTDNRPAGRIGGGDLPVPAVDPRNADTVIIASTVSYRSTDGGKTWIALRGAPGGDDYQRPWISPVDSKIIAMASDQGAIISVNGGDSWSSWYNQPTSQMYHVNADNAFPYRVCGGQQESGSACVASRGNDGMITFREWHPVGVEEYGYAVPDPLNADIIYGGKVTRYNRKTGQVQNIAPTPVRPADFRTLRTAPVAFSPADPHVMYFASNTLWKTATGGRSWTQISKDLTRATWDAPATIGKYRGADTAKPTQRGVIYTVAPSPLDVNRIWIGTDDGLVQMTTDGGASWHDVTPPELKPFMKVSIVDAGHFDTQTAYAAINTLRLDDMRPHIYRTHDGGKSWTAITNGIPDGAPVDAVREDPQRRGLLFAGTERAVYVSFDDGEHWQSLRLNMPATSIRDVIVKGDDLIAGTHGRGIWILDDITPLRQMTSNGSSLTSLNAAAVQAADCLSGPPEHEHRHADPARRSRRDQSAGRRDHQLHARGGGFGSGDARDSRRRRQVGPAIFEHRSQREPGRIHRAGAALLVSRAANAVRQRRHAPLSVGHSLSTDPRRRRRPRRPADRGGAARHRARAFRPVGAARRLHREADGRRQELHAAADAEDGSARHDAGARPRAAVHAVEAALRRDHRRAEDARGDPRQEGEPFRRAKPLG